MGIINASSGAIVPSERGVGSAGAGAGGAGAGDGDAGVEEAMGVFVKESVTAVVCTRLISLGTSIEKSMYSTIFNN